MGGLIVLFSMTAHFLYGSRIQHFSKLFISTLQMLRWLVGDVDYDELHEIRPALTPMVYGMFQLIFFFLALNMLIAIIINQFDVVAGKASRESKWKREVPGCCEDFRIRYEVNTLVFRSRCTSYICCCCREKARRVLALIEMGRVEAQEHVSKKIIKHGTPEKNEKSRLWILAHDEVMHYWKCNAMLMFQKQFRRLQRFGKTRSTGTGGNLYAFLEELYNSWEIRAMEGLEGGFMSNDSRLPIAVISANRLAFFVCKTESFDAVNESSDMFAEKLQTKMVVDAKTKRAVIISAKRLTGSHHKNKKKFNGICGGKKKLSLHTVREQNSELIQRGVNLAEKTIEAFYSVSSTIVVGPLNSNINEWTNATAIKGEKLRLNMSKEQIRGCLYECRVSTAMVSKDAKVRHIFVDETSAQLYILEECNIRTRQEHFKATGPIRVILDLFYLQQIQVDQIDERYLTLLLDDNVGRSFRLQFRSKRRRDTCIDLLVHACQMFTGTSQTTEEDEMFEVYSDDEEDSGISTSSQGHNADMKETREEREQAKERLVQVAKSSYNGAAHTQGGKHRGKKGRRGGGHRGSTVMMPGSERPTFIRSSAKTSPAKTSPSAAAVVGSEDSTSNTIPGIPAGDDDGCAFMTKKSTKQKRSPGEETKRSSTTVKAQRKKSVHQLDHPTRRKSRRISTAAEEVSMRGNRRARERRSTVMRPTADLRKIDF